MKLALLLVMVVLPGLLFSSPKHHRVRLVLNVIDDSDRAIKLQDTTIGNKMFESLIDGDESLAFLNDVGFRYVNEIIVDISNSTADKMQTVVIRTANDRVIVKRMSFFVFPDKQPSKYVYAPEMFEHKPYDRIIYYLASYSN